MLEEKIKFNDKEIKKLDLNAINFFSFYSPAYIGIQLQELGFDAKYVKKIVEQYKDIYYNIVQYYKKYLYENDKNTK